MANLGAVLTNAQVSLAADVTGTLPVANGGTGATASTGTGSVVLAGAPTLTGTVTVGTVSGAVRMPSETLTIATGAVTKAKSFIIVDTEASAASDDLDTISGGTAGDFLIVKAANDARSVVIRNNGGGTGNVRTEGTASITLDDANDMAILFFDGTNWLELSRADVAPQTYAASNVITDRTYDANATTVDELADVLGSLIADLRAKGLVL